MHDLCFCIETELLQIQDWFSANKLMLNVDKSVYLLFTSHGQRDVDFKLMLNGVEIPRVRSAKLLGTWIDDRLTWETHVNKLLTKVKCTIGMLQCSKKNLTTKAKRLLYFGKIHSNLCYCLSIWGTMIQKRLQFVIAKVQ